MYQAVDQLFINLFAIFSTFGNAVDHLKTDPKFSGKHTHYSWQLNKCINDVGHDLVRLLAIINTNNKILSVSTKQNALQFTRAFYLEGDGKRIEISKELISVSSSNALQGRMIELVFESVQMSANEAERYFKEIEDMKAGKSKTDDDIDFL